MALGTLQANLWNEGLNAFLVQDFERAEALLLKALSLKDDDIIYYHLTLTALIKLYHRKRDEWEGAYTKCINYCHEDLGVIFSDEFLHNDFCLNGPPHCPSITRLLIDLERKGEYAEAIGLCEKAISFGFSDDTKGGFNGRLAKLLKKARASS